MADVSKKGTKPEEEKKPGPAPEEAPKTVVRVPLLIDFTLSVAKMIVILVGILTAVISLIAGATLTVAALRSAAAIFSVGLAFWMVNWWIANYSLEAVRLELKEELEAEQHPPSTVERSA